MLCIGKGRHNASPQTKTRKTHTMTTETKNRFKTKSGELTPYALACGYIQEKENDGKRITLWHEGGQVYHVMLFDHKNHKRIFWESFERLTDARALYRKTKIAA